MNHLININYLVADILANPNSTSGYYISLTGILVLGFISAVAIGSIAWYNSKRPAGWESKERPDFVPNVEKQENPGL
ncbi:MAG: hypothetical protein AAF378_18415 [Cyanobacteria bacterium P01_A01_bin.84]